MYLFIFESIGTSELFLIGMIALIVFGPRKLPQMGRTIGKTMADFRRTTNEFKATWEKEAEFYQEEKIINPIANTTTGNPIANENAFSKTTNETTVIEAPAIKEVEQNKIDEILSRMKTQNSENSTLEKKENEFLESDKRNWL